MLDSMLPWLHRIEFQWAWLWLVLPLPLAARLLPPPRLAHRQSVQVPNLPNLLPDAQPAARTPGRGKIRAIVFAASRDGSRSPGRRFRAPSGMTCGASVDR